MDERPQPLKCPTFLLVPPPIEVDTQPTIGPCPGMDRLVPPDTPPPAGPCPGMTLPPMLCPQPPKCPDFLSIPPMLATKHHQRAMYEFLSGKDANFAEVCYTLMSVHSFDSVCLLVYERFGMLPCKWDIDECNLPLAPPKSQMDHLINEVLDSEKKFIGTILGMQLHFVDHLFHFFSNEDDVKKVQQLGLTLDECI
jgi:hypothetical protein